MTDAEPYGLTEFEADPRCPNGCVDPVLAISILQATTYQVQGKREWEHQETIEMGILLSVYCMSCACHIIDRSVEEALAIELRGQQRDQLGRAKKQGRTPLEKGPNKCRRKFSLPSKTEP